MRSGQLRDHRARLDQRIAGQGVNLAMLGRELHALLAAPIRDGWDNGQEEGRIDGRCLAQLIASPTERRLFRTERIESVADCALGVLIDCSGSMKKHIESLAMVFDVFVRALEQAGVASELLGFMTGAWNGGRARRGWLRGGRPVHPCGLYQACNVAFQSAETASRRARASIAALRQCELLREGIDGEAVDSAVRRLSVRTEKRRLLLVVSDGSPMDSATNLSNDAHPLDQHLRDVFARHEQASVVRIFGVGVGLDLSPYFRRSHVLDLAGSTGDAVFRALIELTGRR